MADLSAALTLPGLATWAYDPTRGVLNLLTSDGELKGWDVAARAFTYARPLGFSPSDADVSADGRYLVVGDAAKYLTSDPFAVEKTWQAQVVRIDLGELSTHALRFGVTHFEKGVAEVATAADGRVLVTMDVNGSGWGGVRALDLNASANVVPATVVTGASVPDGSSLLTSDADRFVLVQQVLSTPSEAALYDSASGRLVAKTNAHNLGVSYQWGGGDISEARGLVVAVGSKTFVFDLQMQAQADLSVYNRAGVITGAAFSPDASRLYLWHGAQSHVTVVNTNSWAEVGNLDFSLTTASPTYASDVTMDITADGKFLLLESGGTLELIDIASRLNTQLAPVEATGTAGPDTLPGGSANDVLAGGDGANMLRGFFGDDTLTGGSNFDDLHGNQGNDSVRGGGADDWVVGGKGDDRVFGDDGSDLVYGQLGQDTLEGGAGNDGVVGGQGNDVLRGGDGDDWLTGDRGDDALYGGAGADVFYFFREAGGDIVHDFKAVDGDRVQLSSGAVYTVAQQGADVVINMENVARLTLTNVQLSSLPTGWLFEG